MNLQNKCFDSHAGRISTITHTSTFRYFLYKVNCKLKNVRILQWPTINYDANMTPRKFPKIKIKNENEFLVAVNNFEVLFEMAKSIRDQPTARSREVNRRI